MGRNLKHADGRYKTTRVLFEEDASKILADPTDYLILSALPKKGATVGGVIPLAATARDIGAEALQGLMDSNGVMGRLRAMKTVGLTASVVLPRSDSDGWQITKEGEQVLAEWKETNDKEAS